MLYLSLGNKRTVDLTGVTAHENVVFHNWLRILWLLSIIFLSIHECALAELLKSLSLVWDCFCGLIVKPHSYFLL